MTKYQSIEKILNDYKLIEIQIKNLQIELKHSEADGIAAIDYSRDRLCNSYKISSIVENLGFKENKEKKLIEKELNDLEYIKEKIDNALNLLNERDKEIVKLRYIYKVPAFNIARQFHLNESSARNIRKKAISKMSKLFK